MPSGTKFWKLVRSSDKVGLSAWHAKSRTSRQEDIPLGLGNIPAHVIPSFSPGVAPCSLRIFAPLR